MQGKIILKTECFDQECKLQLVRQHKRYLNQINPNEIAATVSKKFQAGENKGKRNNSRSVLRLWKTWNRKGPL